MSGWSINKSIHSQDKQGNSLDNLHCYSLDIQEAGDAYGEKTQH